MTLAADGIRFRLPGEMRAALQVPLGRVLGSAEAVAAARGAPFLATVGDVTTDTFLSAGIVPHLMIVDHRTQRKPSPLRPREKLKNSPVVAVQAKSPAGVVSNALWSAVEEATRSMRPTLLEVEGEEDLATLPAILLAPEGAAVCYGQPDQGVVVVRVDDEARRLVGRLLSRMEVE